MPGAISPVLSSLSVGEYWCTITDSNGCTLTVGPYIIDSTTLQFTYNQSDISCVASNDGSITLIPPTVSTAPYTYLWNDPLAQTNDTATGL